MKSGLILYSLVLTITSVQGSERIATDTAIRAFPKLAPSVKVQVDEDFRIQQKLEEHHEQQVDVIEKRLEQYERTQEKSAMAPLIYIDESEQFPAYIDVDSSISSAPVHTYDSRYEISSLTLALHENQRVFTNAFSILGIVNGNQLRTGPREIEIRHVKTLRECFQLCPDQPYIDQPVLCIGTAFLVAQNIVLTARHNLELVPFQNMKFVAGYRMEVSTGKAKTSFPSDDIYAAKTIIRSQVLDKFDLVLIKLDRDIEGAVALPIDPIFKAEVREPVYTLGYPVGLPMKYITNASIIKTDGQYNFYTTLDTFRGNSGSPVFSRKSHSVVGILVEGSVDFKQNGDCNVSTICGQNCIGERVVNASALRSHIMWLIHDQR